MTDPGTVHRLARHYCPVRQLLDLELGGQAGARSREYQQRIATLAHLGEVRLHLLARRLLEAHTAFTCTSMSLLMPLVLPRSAISRFAQQLSVRSPCGACLEAVKSALTAPWGDGL